MDLAEKLKRITKQDTDTNVMTVLSVDRSNGTCVCDDGTVEHTDVRLSAIIDDKLQKFYIIPKLGGTVLVSPIESNYTFQYITAVSEPEALYLCTGQVVLDIDKDGFLLKKENETLRKLVLDLITAIKAMKFTTNVGPTIALLNVADFTALENRFKDFLKAN